MMAQVEEMLFPHMVTLSSEIGCQVDLGDSV